jgi:hypothetical protein
MILITNHLTINPIDPSVVLPTTIARIPPIGGAPIITGVLLLIGALIEVITGRGQIKGVQDTRGARDIRRPQGVRIIIEEGGTPHSTIKDLPHISIIAVMTGQPDMINLISNFCH